MKKCPKCNLSVSDSEKECFCGYTFPDEEPVVEPDPVPPKESKPKKVRKRKDKKEKKQNELKNKIVGTVVLAIIIAIIFHPGKKPSDEEQAKQTAEEAQKTEEERQNMLKFDDEKYHSHYKIAMDSIINRYANVKTHTVESAWVFSDFDDEDDGIVVGMTDVDVDGIVAKQKAVCVFKTDPDFNDVCHYLYCVQLIVDDGIASETMSRLGLPTK